MEVSGNTMPQVIFVDHDEVPQRWFDRFRILGMGY
jgi:hypothetical protein